MPTESQNLPADWWLHGAERPSERYKGDAHLLATGNFYRNNLCRLTATQTPLCTTHIGTANNVE